MAESVPGGGPIGATDAMYACEMRWWSFGADGSAVKVGRARRPTASLMVPEAEV